MEETFPAANLEHPWHPTSAYAISQYQKHTLRSRILRLEGRIAHLLKNAEFATVTATQMLTVMTPRA